MWLPQGFFPWLNAPSSPKYWIVWVGQQGKKKILVPIIAFATLASGNQRP